MIVAKIVDTAIYLLKRHQYIQWSVSRVSCTSLNSPRYSSSPGWLALALKSLHYCEALNWKCGDSAVPTVRPRPILPSAANASPSAKLWLARIIRKRARLISQTFFTRSITISNLNDDLILHSSSIYKKLLCFHYFMLLLNAQKSTLA